MDRIGRVMSPTSTSSRPESEFDQMSSHVPVRRPVGARVLGVLVAAFLVFGAAACSSDSSSDADSEAVREGSEAGSDAGTPESDGGSNAGLPDGFPTDVPLPEFTDISVVKRATDDTPGIWSVVVTIDPTLNESGEDLKAAYGAQLEAAGYVVEDIGAGVLEAVGDDWEVHVHSVMDGTLTIGTAPK